MLLNYLYIDSIFLLKNGTEYTPYKDLNKNATAWIRNDFNTSLLKNNSQELLEIPVDISNIEFKGSSQSIKKLEEVISTFRLRLDREKMNRDAYLNCLNDKACSKIIYVPDSDIVNAIIKDLVWQQENVPMKNEDYEALNMRIN